MTTPAEEIVLEEARNHYDLPDDELRKFIYDTAITLGTSVTQAWNFSHRLLHEI